jgi:hypothetical protein
MKAAQHVVLGWRFQKSRHRSLRRVRQASRNETFEERVRGVRLGKKLRMKLTGNKPGMVS